MSTIPPTVFAVISHGIHLEHQEGSPDFSTAPGEQGALYYLGTVANTKPYANPANPRPSLEGWSESYLVDTTTSDEQAQESIQRYARDRLAQNHPAGVVPKAEAHESVVTNQINYLRNKSNQWMQLSLPAAGGGMVVDYYCLRHGGSGSCALRNWELQGSVDEQTWVVLRTHEDDEAIGTAALSTAGWAVERCAGGAGGGAGVTFGAFRHFRIQQTGLDASNMNHLCCSGIELYGTLFL
jgi:hypothetical protein